MGDTMQQRLTQDLTQFLASLPEDDRIGDAANLLI